MLVELRSTALAGDRMIHLDNLEGNFGNDTLDRALTATRWKDRILGKSQEVDLPLIPVWYGTGNNVAVAADTTRIQASGVDRVDRAASTAPVDGSANDPARLLQRGNAVADGAGLWQLRGGGRGSCARHWSGPDSPFRV
jgi:hypothetical protein